MHRICLDVFGELGADGAGGGFLGVGGAHDLAVFGDGAFALEDLENDGAGDHEGDEAGEEGALAVDAVEFLGLGAGEEGALLGDDAQAGGLEGGVDLAGEVPAGGVGLDDGERALDGHWGDFRWFERRLDEGGR